MEPLDLSTLYSRPLPSSRTGALFNAFSYPTKISPEAVALFVACHTSPGESILDAFAGSGTTGVAALLCDRPTDFMKALATELGLTPTWGPRNAVLYELGSLGAFVADGLCHPPDADVFLREAVRILSQAETDLAGIYTAITPEGETGVLRHIVWSEVLICQACRYETSYWDAVVRMNPLHFASSFTCASCGTSLEVRAQSRVTEEIDDFLLGTRTLRRVRVPARVFGRSGSHSWQRPPTERDRRTIAFAERIPFPVGTPVEVLEWGDLRRAGYHLGMTHIHHMYTRRNYLVLSTMMRLVSEAPRELQSALRLWVLSYNSSHSTLMTRVVAKTNQNDLVITGAQPGVMYVSALPVEKNIISGLRRKITTFVEAFRAVSASRSTVRVVNGDCSQMAVPDGSIDYIFTDPPFADFIPYAELNQLNEVWLPRRTSREREMIVSPAQGKDLAAYQQMMEAAFREMRRVLQPRGLATIVFHAARAAVWRSLQEAYTAAGFSLLMTSILDKLQGSFKQVSAQMTVKGDPLLLLAPTPEGPSVDRTNVKGEDFILRALIARAHGETGDIKERTVEWLFARYVTQCLETRTPVALDASEFYARVQELQEAGVTS